MIPKSITALAVAVAGLASAQATTIYDITGDHATGGLGTPPFGTVALTQSGANVDITVHLVTGYSFVTTGAADDQYFKFNGVGVALADITFGTAGMKANTGSFNGNGTGAFVFGIGPDPLNGGINKFVGDLNFTVKSATINDLISVPNVISTGENIIFVADLLSPNGNTGPAYVTTTTTNVPDGGATLALLGVGLLGLGAIRRKLS